MKRWLQRIFVFLLLGAIVNVAVAWGCTVFLRYEPSSEYTLPIHESLAVWTDLAPQEWPRGEVHGTRHTYWARRTHVLWLNVPARGDWLMYVKEAGWPVRSMCGVKLHEYGQPFVLVGLIDSYEELPFHPLWPGFATNTLFYAAIVWLLCALPFALRRWRRIRRGLCPKCAYPVGTSEVCTECGIRTRLIPRSQRSGGGNVE